jgi:hypothetical protein
MHRVVSRVLALTAQQLAQRVKPVTQLIARISFLMAFLMIRVSLRLLPRGLPRHQPRPAWPRILVSSSQLSSLRASLRISAGKQSSSRLTSWCLTLWECPLKHVLKQYCHTRSASLNGLIDVRFLAVGVISERRKSTGIRSQRNLSYIFPSYRQGLALHRFKKPADGLTIGWRPADAD